MENKVLITGLNIISSLGLNAEDNWQNLLLAKSGVKKISLFDPSGLQTQIAAQVSDSFENYSIDRIKKRQARQMSRVTKMCYVCTKDLIEKEKINFDDYDKTRCAVILGVVNIGDESIDKTFDSKNKIIRGMNNAMSAWISLDYKLLGPNYTIATACSSSAYAIANGYDLIKSGKADIVITGGADSTINPVEINGFNELYALSVENDLPEKASKPFSKNRDGFVIGEGAGIMILESAKSANARNAKVYAELSGYGLTSEAYNIMAPMADGEGMALSMETAIKNSGISKDKIDYISAHGTSTTLNDKYETQAIKKVFGDRAFQIPVSSQKSMIGHTIGAAGVIEGAVTCLSILNEEITPTINLEEKDPELDLDYVPNKSRKHKIDVAISNSFAFGGHNATLVFRKYK